jgi:hypothetical protein
MGVASQPHPTGAYRSGPENTDQVNGGFDSHTLPPSPFFPFDGTNGGAKRIAGPTFTARLSVGWISGYTLRFRQRLSRVKESLLFFIARTVFASKKPGKTTIVRAARRNEVLLLSNAAKNGESLS